MLSAINFVNATSKICAAGSFLSAYNNNTGMFVCTTPNATDTNTAQGLNLGTHGVGLYFGNANATQLEFLKLLSTNPTCTVTSNATNAIINCSDTNTAQVVNADNGQSLISSKFNATETKLMTLRNATAYVLFNHNSTSITPSFQFKIDNITCSGNSKVSAFNNATGQFTCTGGIGTNTAQGLNIGIGTAKVYAGNANATQLQLRTILGTGGASATNDSTTITIHSNQYQNNTGQNIGHGGYGPFAQLLGSTLQFKNITSTNNSLLSILANGTDINLTPVRTFNDVIPASYVVSINKTTGLYQVVNGTTQNISFSGSDVGLILQKSINNMPNGGLIFIKHGNYTALTQLRVNRSSIDIAGEGYNAAASPGSTILKFNVGPNTDGISVNGSKTVYADIFRDITFMRSSIHSAKNIMHIGVNHAASHTTFQRVTFFEPNQSNFEDLKIENADATYINNCMFLRLSGLAGNETIPYIIVSQANIQTIITDTHIVTPGGLASPPNGIFFASDFFDKLITDSLDSLGYPLTISTSSPVNLIHVGFYNDKQNSPRVLTSGFFAGTWNNYGSPSNQNFTEIQQHIRIDTTNTIVDSTDIKKQAGFDATGLNTNHTQSYILPDKNGTLALLSDLTGGTITGSQNVGKATGSVGSLAIPSSTTIKSRNFTGTSPITITKTNDTDVSIGCSTCLITAITSLNGDTTAAQNVVRQFGNITVTNSTNTHTIGLGVNPVIINGASQNITKVINFTKEVFLQPSTTVFGSINFGIGGTDPTTPKQGDMWYNSATGLLKYRTSATRVIIDDSQAQTVSGAKTFTTGQIFSGSGAAEFKQSANTLKVGATSLIIKNPATTFATTVAGSSQTANQTITLPVTRQAETFAVVPQTAQKTNVTVQTTASASFVMTGNSLTITPQVTGNIKVEFTGYSSSGTLLDGCTIEMQEGTGTAPHGGNAVSGTTVGVSIIATSATANANVPFSIIYPITGLAKGTTVWFEPAFSNAIGGTCSMRNNMIVLTEY